MRRCGWTIAWVLFALAPLAGHAAEYAIGAVPAWVVAVEPGKPSATQIGKGSGGVAYLLTDTQILAGADTRVRYHRLVSTALNASGVESIANIEIPFDPSYQHLMLHSVRIIRHGHIIAKLGTARIRVIQRETELETRIYDGTKTVSIFLDDVRVGDTIDYAYSTTGRNPVFRGFDFGTFSLQYGEPVARIHARLLLPLGKRVTITPRHTTLKPLVSEHDGFRDYQWNTVDAPTLSVEQGAPPWYSPYAELAWSEYPDWAAVAQWAQPLYRVPEKLSPALQAEVDRIARAEPTQAGRMLAALRFVQSEVRYLGVEIGQNSHAPNPPETVFARRFGDCKDKTLLTLTLLGRLGVEAHAGLVNTSLRRGIADELPNPGAFDHVLVRARVAGQNYWIDPTRFTQQADLAHLYQPDYGLALIVDAQTHALISMKTVGAAAGARHLQVVFDASAGFDKPVRYSVVTISDGDQAESLRATLSSTNLEDVQKNYLNFYANSYPHITVAAPLRVSDDKPDNRITTTESYTIADIARPSSEDKRQIADIYAPDIAQLLRDPDVTIRKAPLQLAYPRDVSQRTEVLLSGDWPIKPSSTRIDDPAFHFEHTVRLAGSQLIITDHFQSLTDEIPAADMSRYLANLARARDAVGYELWWSDPAAASAASRAGRASLLDRMNWPVALLALAMFGFWTWLAVVSFRYDPEPDGARDGSLDGIGGWLLLLAVGLTLRPFVFGAQLLQLADAVSIDKWAALTTYGSSHYNALWAPLLLFELAVNSMQLVFSLLLLVLFFRRRSSFPRAAILILFASVVLVMGDLMLASLLPTISTTSEDIARVVRTALGAIIWSAYLLRSRRVKSTFARRYRVSAPPPLPRVPVPPEPAGPTIGTAIVEPQ